MRAEGPAYTVLPYAECYRLPDRAGVPSWEAAWKEASPQGSFVLESGKVGRYTYLGLSPVSVLTGKGDSAVVRSPDAAGRWREMPLAGRPLEVIRSWMKPYLAPEAPGWPKFMGGCVGYWSYDVVRSLEKLPTLAEDDLALPDYKLLRIEELWVLDHQENALYCCVHLPVRAAGEEEVAWERLRQLYEEAEVRAAGMKRLWDRVMSEASTRLDALRRERRWEELRRSEDRHRVSWSLWPEVRPSFSPESYMQAVEAIRRYIGQGDVFQVNLSVRQSVPETNAPEPTYEWLRLINPSPYMGLLRFPGLTLVSGSPELLVRRVGSRLETRPIAGTRPRGSSPADDERLAAELIGHEKERAEHIMLVDLLRNDIGRVSRYGSVRVDELMAIEHYSHVMHIVSHISGELAAGRDEYDVIAALFPGGTITGAPKIRTMEIIEELEPVRRGPYTGSIGWIDYNGNMELNITIRTMVVHDGRCHIQAGAGIVIDSVPEREYVESLNKAKALWKAMEYARDTGGTGGGDTR